MTCSVLKFGGTSVASADRWAAIAERARAAVGDGTVVIVVSALRGITDLLEAFCEADDRDVTATGREVAERHRALLADLGLPADTLDTELSDLDERLARIAAEPDNPAFRAALLGTGELLSSRLGTAYLESTGLDAAWLDSRELLTARRDGRRHRRAAYLAAECEAERDPARAADLAGRARIHVAPGFIARNAEGETVLLGRGGSDTSAACLGAVLGAERVEIWSDVPGLFTADPRHIPGARLLKLIGYREAQELAAMGAKALHPRALIPLRRHGIPLHLRQTDRLDIEGTRIAADARDHGAQVKAIVQRQGIVLIALEGLDMWQEVGFLADVFEVFKRHGLSVDLVSTSESNVTVTLDPGANATDRATLDALSRDLEQLCKVEVMTGCASVSLVGNGIRTILHRLGPALEVFEQRRIFLVSQAANDLNLTFVVEARHAERLVQQLHQQVIPGGVGGDSVFGPTWEQLFQRDTDQQAAPAWWRDRAADLRDLMADRESAYVYAPDEIRRAADRLRGLSAVDRVLYSMKANPHPAVLETVRAAGLGLECVSVHEIRHALATLPDLKAAEILFTPNFAPRAEYRAALELGVRMTLDNPWILEHWGRDFAGREVLLRLDPGSGLGHHRLVRTAGTNAKFGIPLSDLERVLRLCAAHDIRVVGLHAHTGSGIMHPDNWHRTLEVLSEAARELPELRVVNLGGGLGIPDKDADLPLDLAALDGGLARIKSEIRGDFEVWIEPGRYLVAQAGVLLAKVTQTKGKGETRYVGLTTGMNSLIRPALYGAWHEIVNLSRLDEPGDHVYNVVGPVCETGDILGLDRLLPECREGDVVLIANTGAYGAVMASNYNLRAPAEEVVIGGEPGHP